MASRKWISPHRLEGVAPRQAHTNLPEGTYEREMGREGFFGPATQLYHAHPPTDWIAWDGPMRPRAFDSNDLAETDAGPWGAAPVLVNAHVQFRIWRGQGAMDHLRVSARPRDLPEGILLDVSGLDIGDAIYVRDIELPDVVTVLDQPDELVAHVVAMRGIEGEEDEEGEEGEDALAEPELVGKDGAAGSSED